MSTVVMVICGCVF